MYANLSSGNSSLKGPRGHSFYRLLRSNLGPLKGTHSVDSIVSRASGKLGPPNDFTRAKTFHVERCCYLGIRFRH